MRIRLWHSPYNGGWIWFSRENLKRIDAGWEPRNHKLWWALFGFSGSIILRSWPWQRPPGEKSQEWWSRALDEQCYLTAKAVREAREQKARLLVAIRKLERRSRTRGAEARRLARRLDRANNEIARLTRSEPAGRR